MEEPPRLSIGEHVADLPDPRRERSKRHPVLDIVTIALCAVICGADSWAWGDVELFGRATLPWLRPFLAVPNGIPSHDTFGRLFARLDPTAFARCFRAWVQAIVCRTTGEVVAVAWTARCCGAPLTNARGRRRWTW